MIELPQKDIEKLSSPEKAIYYAFHGKQKELDDIIRFARQSCINIGSLQNIIRDHPENYKNIFLIYAIRLYGKDSLRNPFIPLEEYNSPYLIKNLLQNGTDINKPDDKGCLPIFVCFLEIHNVNRLFYLITFFRDIGADLCTKGSYYYRGKQYFDTLGQALRFIVTLENSLPEEKRLYKLQCDFFKRLNSLLKNSRAISESLYRLFPKIISEMKQHHEILITLPDIENFLKGNTPEESNKIISDLSTRYIRTLDQMLLYFSQYSLDSPESIPNLERTLRILSDINTRLSLGYTLDFTYHSLLLDLTGIKNCLKYHQPIIIRNDKIEEAKSSTAYSNSEKPKLAFTVGNEIMTFGSGPREIQINF